MFRIDSLKLEGHTQLGDLEIKFSEESEIFEKLNPYSSVIIGPNGTGKSYILRTIIDLFRELFELKNKGSRRKYVPGNYILNYYIDNTRFTYSNNRIPIILTSNQKSFPIVSNERKPKGISNAFHINKDGKSILPSEIELPGSILASSIMLTDKYIFVNKKEEYQIYEYLGIRASRATAGTRTYIRNTIKLLANSKEKGIFKRTLPRILQFLELDNHLFLRYFVKRKETFFTENVREESFIKFVGEYEEALAERRKKDSSKTIIPWYALQHYQKLIKDTPRLNMLISFLKQKYSEHKKADGSGSDFFDYDLLNNLEQLEDEMEMIELLENLNLIGPPVLYFKKSGSTEFDFEGSSSGEAHFLTSVIGILSTVTKNSIILIDEPEISLHPNWQMKYMQFLREAFSEFYSCHFIIATHSHFLISDLKGESSKIIGLKRSDNNEIVEIPNKMDTFGWSAEDVLYRVFGVRTTRNYYMEVEMRELLNLITRKSDNKVQLTDIVNRLERVELNREDPLNLILDQAKEYIQSI